MKSWKLEEESEARRAVVDAVSRKKPVYKKAGRGKAVATRPVPEEKQAFTGRAMAVGNAEVPTLSIVSQDQNDLNLQVKVNDFTFDDIFVDFNSPAKSFFVFDDVNIHLRQQTSGDAITSTMRFNGTLRMNQEPLTTLKNFLKCDEGLMVAGETGQPGSRSRGSLSRVRTECSSFSDAYPSSSQSGPSADTVYPSMTKSPFSCDPSVA